MVERRSPRKRISFGFPSGELRINPLADEDCEVARPVDDAVATPVLTAGWAPALLRHRVATDPDTPRSSVAASPYDALHDEVAGRNYLGRVHFMEL